MLTLILFLALVPLVAWRLHVDLKEADRRRRLRRLTEPMRRATMALQATIGAALLPSMVRAAADLERSMRKVSEAMAAYPDALARLQAMAEDLRRP